MYYTTSRLGANVNFAQQAGQSLLDVLKGGAQTQQDIKALAQTAKAAQQPDVLNAVQTYAGIQLLLQAVGTIAMVGMFMIALKKHRGG